MPLIKAMDEPSPITAPTQNPPPNNPYINNKNREINCIRQSHNNTDPQDDTQTPLPRNRKNNIPDYTTPQIKTHIDHNPYKKPKSITPDITNTNEPQSFTRRYRQTTLKLPEENVTVTDKEDWADSLNKKHPDVC